MHAGAWFIRRVYSCSGADKVVHEVSISDVWDVIVLVILIKTHEPFHKC